MISNHKDFLGKESKALQDTTKNKSNLLLFNSLQKQDTVEKGDLNLNEIVISNSDKSFTPLPSIDSSRQFPKKQVWRYDPLKTAEYLTYKDVSFDISDAGILFFEKPFYPSDELHELICDKTTKTDSNLPESKEQKTKEVTSIKEPFVAKEIITKNPVDESLSSSVEWVLGVLIFATIIFGWIRVFYNRKIKSLTDAVFNNQWSKKIYEEKNAISQRISFFLNVLFITNTSLFIFLLFKYFNLSIVGYDEFQTFMVILISLIIIYISKAILLQIGGFLVLAQKSFGEYTHNVFLYNKAFGIVIFPILWIIPFVSEHYLNILIYLGIILFVLSYSFRVFEAY